MSEKHDLVEVCRKISSWSRKKKSVESFEVSWTRSIWWSSYLAPCVYAILDCMYCVRWRGLCTEVCLWTELSEIKMSGVQNLSKLNQKHYFALTFRSLTEIFIRRSWYSVLPRLDAMIYCHVKKAFLGVTELITALVLIHGSLTFLSDVHCFFDPPGKPVLSPSTIGCCNWLSCFMNFVHQPNKSTLCLKKFPPLKSL